MPSHSLLCLLFDLPFYIFTFYYLSILLNLPLVASLVVVFLILIFLVTHSTLVLISIFIALCCEQCDSETTIFRTNGLV